MLSEAEAAVSQASTAGARRTGLLLFAGVIAEFSPVTASPMNLPWDFHERCRASLESEFMRDFFNHGAGIARNAAESGGALSGADDGECVAALRQMAVVLAWDPYAAAGRAAAAVAPSGTSWRARAASTATWRRRSVYRRARGGGTRYTLPVGTIGCLVCTRRRTRRPRRRRGRWVRRRSALGPPGMVVLAAAQRSLTVSLCSLSGAVFPLRAEDPVAGGY